MDIYDAIIIGAGPAGCQCAKELSKSGVRVLLIEKVSDFDHNDFSSAGSPIVTMQSFNLPDDIVGAYWNEIRITTSNTNHKWSSNDKLGVVLDFTKLKEFLISKAKLENCKFLLGNMFVSYRENKTNIEVKVLDIESKEEKIYMSKVLVDATGPSRSVIHSNPDSLNLILCSGLECLIEISSNVSTKYNPNTLEFLLGYRWMPHGYAWIFPMGSTRFKVGAGYIQDNKFIKDIKFPLKKYIEQVIKDHLRLKSYKVIDTHGSSLRYSEGQKDIFYKSRIIAIGDAISSINPLGGEGIRHAMHTATIAPKHILKHLEDNSYNFKNFEKEIKNYFGLKWKISEKLSKLVYTALDDKTIDIGSNYISKLTTDELMRILFFYEYDKLDNALDDFALSKLKKLFNLDGSNK